MFVAIILDKFSIETDKINSLNLLTVQNNINVSFIISLNYFFVACFTQKNKKKEEEKKENFNGNI